MWNGANWRGAGHGAFRQVGVAQELIGSLWFDAEQWWQVCVARLSEPLLHVSTVAGHRGNCHSSASWRDRRKERGCEGNKESEEWEEEVKDNYERIKIDSTLFTLCLCLFQLKGNQTQIMYPFFQSCSSYSMMLTVLASGVIKLNVWTCLVSRKGCDCFKAS